jgi:hypothetical protein
MQCAIETCFSINDFRRIYNIRLVHLLVCDIWWIFKIHGATIKITGRKCFWSGWMYQRLLDGIEGTHDEPQRLCHGGSPPAPTATVTRVLFSAGRRSNYFLSLFHFVFSGGGGGVKLQSGIPVSCKKHISQVFLPLEYCVFTNKVAAIHTPALCGCTTTCTAWRMIIL